MALAVTPLPTHTLILLEVPPLSSGLAPAALTTLTKQNFTGVRECCFTNLL